MLTSEHLQQLVGPEIEIMAFYNLAHYAPNMSALYQDLSTWMQNTWPGGVARFWPNQRLVFLHDDLDVIMHADHVPFTLYNLQLVLRELNISNCFVRVISNLDDYQIFADRVAHQLVADQPIQCISNSVYGNSVCNLPYATTALGYDPGIDDMTLRTQYITWPFLLQSRQSRLHRTYFMSQVMAAGLGTQGMIAYNNVNDFYHIERPSTRPAPASLNFVTLQPFYRHNPEYVIHNRRRRHELDQFMSVPNFYHGVEPEDVSNAIGVAGYVNHNVASAAIYVSLESTANLPRPYVTSITFRALVNLRPVLTLGSVGVLSWLRDQGFQTFSDFWDESYDHMPRLEDRTAAMICILKEWSALDAAQLQTRISDMAGVLQHNHQHFRTAFAQQQRRALIQGMQ